ncbi:hypothetical protein TNCV_2962561 [Trichonephila clavipes]|nr:hypothetical protein TNCV_2962561 [Trichonephila clavipes]
MDTEEWWMSPLPIPIPRQKLATARNAHRLLLRHRLWPMRSPAGAGRSIPSSAVRSGRNERWELLYGSNTSSLPSPKTILILLK